MLPLIFCVQLLSKSEIHLGMEVALRYLDWAEVHKLCLKSVEAIRGDRRMVAILHLIEQFVDYLEVVVMTEFNGFKNSDFDFWVIFLPPDIKYRFCFTFSSIFATI